MVVLASLMSTENCIDRLQEAIDSYKEEELINGDVEKKLQELLLSCHLMTLHVINKEKGVSGAVDTLKQLKEVEKAHKFFKTERN